MCLYDKNIPINIPSHPYVLLNESILCNCDVETESNFLLESLTACQNSVKDLVMYFTVNLAFVNYFDNLVESLDVPISKNLTTQEQIFTYAWKALKLSPVHWMHQNAERFCTAVQTKEANPWTPSRAYRWGKNKLNPRFSSFLNSFMVDVFLFMTTLITIIIILVVIYVVGGHSKVKALVTNIVLQHLKWVEATDLRFQDVYCACKIQWYVIALLLLIFLGIVFIITNKFRKSNLFQEHLFSNITKEMLFISDTHSYVPLILCKIAGNIHLFRLGGRLTPECIHF